MPADGLARVVAAWATLPEAIRRAILAMIDAARRESVAKRMPT